MPFTYDVKETGGTPFESQEDPYVHAFVILGFQHARKVKIELGTVTAILGQTLQNWVDGKIAKDKRDFLRPYLVEAFGNDHTRREAPELESIDLQLTQPVSETKQTAGNIRSTKFKNEAWSKASPFVKAESMGGIIWANFERAAKSVRRRYLGKAASSTSPQGFAFILFSFLTASRRDNRFPVISFLFSYRTVVGGKALLCKIAHWASRIEPIRPLEQYQMEGPAAYGHLVQYV